MCGFLGKISKDSINSQNFEKINEKIICRGPDEKISKQKLKNDESDLFCYDLIFNRLSIVDLSSLGSQPMSSNKFDTTIVFNGEIFNHVECRQNLEKEGVLFSSNNSDTEVILNGISLYGKSYLNELVGQFSFVFINNKTGYVLMARDRLGQKPLFYHYDNRSLCFSSNLICTSELVNNKKLDDSAINDYFRFSVIPSPFTLYKGIKKLEPGQLIELEFSKDKLNPKLSKYWVPSNFIEHSNFDNEEFDNLIDNAVNIRTKADVPVATFLSGGIDSSSIVKRQYDQGVQPNTFSVRYIDDKYDESKWFNLVSDKYNTNHTVVDVESTVKVEDIFDALACLDEPYSDPSVLPSFIISKAISQKYKVAISGDGGDELFGGYKRTQLTLNRKVWLFADYLFNLYPAVLGTGARIRSHSKGVESSYSSYLDDLKFIKLLGIQSSSNYDLFFNLDDKLNISDQKKLFLSDYKFFLPEMMMLKVDRTSMGNSLEVRSPFVDHRIIEYMLGHKISDTDLFVNKQYLKNYIKNDFNSDFVNREKMGFVFNVEKFIYSNRDFFLQYLQNSNFISYSALKKLFKYKSRINANRVWKILTLEFLVSGKR